MKTSARPLPLFAAILFFLSLALAVFAQEPADKSAPPAAAPPPAEPAKDAPASDSAELRRLDVPEGPKADADENDDESADEKVMAEESDKSAPAAPVAPEPPKKSKHAKPARTIAHHGNGNSNERVSFWGDSTLSAGERADAVVSIFGSSTSAGAVGDAVVSVLGSSTSSGEVGNAVVSVLGDTKVTGGSVGDAAVAVLGHNYVNAPVHGDVVAVLGDVELGPKAVVGGSVVCVGGKVTRDPAATVHGQINNVSIGVHFGGFAWLHAWVRHCLIFGRPLAFSWDVWWAWGLAFGLLGLYCTLALLFPRGIERCAETLEERPGYSILTAFLVTLLAPLAAILLLITIIGAPALLVFLFIAGLFGKAVMLAWLGRRITTRMGGGILAAPVVAVLFGGVIVLLLYTVPFLGFLVAKLLSWLGLGVVVYTLILNSKRNKAARAAAMAAAKPPVAPPVAPVSAAAAAVAPAPTVVAGAVAPEVTEPGVATPAAAVPPVLPSAAPLPPLTPLVAPVAVPSATLPRAGFWIRAGASLLDAVLVAIAMHLLPEMVRPNFMLAVAAYSVVLWALKGTTVGGIVCGLKVVRLDDRPVDWSTAIVRALGGFLSFMVAGLGFIWVAFDDDKQSWHDKIAGTTVVHVPKGTSLV